MTYGHRLKSLSGFATLTRICPDDECLYLPSPLPFDFALLRSGQAYKGGEQEAYFRINPRLRDGFQVCRKLLAEFGEFRGDEVGAVGLVGVSQEVFLVIGFRRVEGVGG